MARLLTVLIVLVVAVIGVLLIAPNFIPMEIYKAQITRAAENATGRALTIDGDLKIAFFPRFQLELNDVTFANREGASPEAMATMDRLAIGLAVMPLLQREVVIDRLVLDRPVMNLEIDRNGRGNWEFDIETAQPAEGSSDSAGGGFALNEVSLGDVRLVDGDVRFRDRRSGADYHLQDIDIGVSLPTLQGPLGFDGQLTYNGERLSLDTEIESPRDFVGGEATPTRIALRSDVVRLAFNGAAATVSGALPVSGGGDVELNVPSLRRLAAWTGSPIESPGGFGRLRITGRADATGNTVNFGNAELVFDEMTGTGNFNFNLAGTRPRIAGDLALNKVDVRPYVGDDSGGGQSQRGNASSEWSTEPIDFSALRAFDAELSITADEVLTPTLRMGRSTLDVTLRNGVLTAVIDEMALYEGSGSARLEVDARNDVAVIREESTFDLVQALPLFSDLANFRSLEGVGMVTLDVTTRGRSQRDFISALNGNGEIRFNDGAIKGINIAQLLRTVGAQLTDIEVPRGPQQTDFAELGGTFQIRDGVVSNVDMRLLNPLLRITGEGNTNLLTRTIDYRINPQAVLSLEGQGATQDVTGTTVPLRIGGTWDDMSFGPDLEAIGRGLLERSLGLGQPQEGAAEGTGDEPASTEEEEPMDPGERLLRGLLGGGGGGSSGDGADGGAPAEGEPAPEEQPEEEEELTPEEIFRRLLEGGN